MSFFTSKASKSAHYMGKGLFAALALACGACSIVIENPTLVVQLDASVPAYPMPTFPDASAVQIPTMPVQAPTFDGSGNAPKNVEDAGSHDVDAASSDAATCNPWLLPDCIRPNDPITCCDSEWTP